MTLIVGLPPRLTSFWIISSQISSIFLSNTPFPPSPAGRLEQLKSPCRGARQRLSLQGAQMQPPNCNCKSSLLPKLFLSGLCRSFFLFVFEFALWLSLQSYNCTHSSATTNHSFSIECTLPINVIIIDVACMLQKTCLTSSRSTIFIQLENPGIAHP